MSENSSTICLTVDNNSLQLLWICLKHFEPVVINNKDEIEVYTSLIGKIAQEMVSDEKLPWGSFFSLSPREAQTLDFAMRMTMVDIKMAIKFGSMADQYVGETRLSSYIEKLPLISEVIEKLDLATQLAIQEHRLTMIEQKLGIVSKNMSEK